MKPPALRLSLLLVLSLPAAPLATAATPAAHPASALASSYGSLPLSFEPNQGQTDPSVQFLVHGQGYTLFLRPGEAVFGLDPSKALKSPQANVLRIQLTGADLKAPAIPEDPQITRTNYFLGNNPAHWRTDIPNYGRVRYRSVYEGIDLVYYGNQRRLEHDFVVAPHADPNQIVLSLTGAQNLQIDPATGDLILLTSTGEDKTSLRLLKPITYQESNGRRIEIPTSYKLLANNKIAFSVAPYDHSQPLTIDPVLTYSTYLGGSGSNGTGDQGNGIAVDSTGNAYVVGTTYSANFPITGGAFETRSDVLPNASTVFVTKLNPAGTALVYSTYLGGSGGDAGYGIALDSQNNAYITGATYSVDFPVTCGAFQTANPSTTNGAATGFVARLNSTGSALEYSTYLGGSGNDATAAHGDVAQAIAVDASGNAYVTGYTYSANFPTTDSALQPNFAGSATVSNAFVTKLNPLGTALSYSTFLGGSGSNGAGDYGNAIALDSSGDAFVTGSTASSNFPVTKGAFQTALGGASNAFVTELNPAGEDEVYSTYLGGSGPDSAQAIALDGSGFAYVAGNTSSSNFPLTTGVLEGANNGIGNYFGNPNDYGTSGNGAFVTKLNEDGTALEYSTYLEGGYTTVTGLAVDSTGTTYITGSAPVGGVEYFWGFQETPDALPVPSTADSAPYVNAGFVVKLNPSATVLNYASLLGGNSIDGTVALALDAAGNVYLTGFANSTDFPTTAAAFQTTNNAAPAGSTNAFVSKFALAAEVNQTNYPILTVGIASFVIADVGPISFECTSYSWSMPVFFELSALAPGPPPTGNIYFWDNYGYYNGSNPYTAQVAPNWDGEEAAFNLSDGEPDDGPYGPFTVGWQVYYPGDAYYTSSSYSGTVETPGCPYPQSLTRHAPQSHAPYVPLGLRAAQGKAPSQQALVSTPAKSGVAGPKFTPQPAIPHELGQRSQAISSVQSQTTPACIVPAQTATPAFSFAGGTYESSQTVAISDSTPGSTIYYTTNGTTPTSASARYTGPLLIKSTLTLQAIAYAPSLAPSPVASAAYTLDAAAPVFSPPSGVYPGPVTVTITSATATAAIAYTPNGSIPSVYATYTGPITLTASGKVYALAHETGFTTSSVSEAIYTIESPAVTPVFSLAAGTYTGAQTLSITDATPGAAIYYTLDGTTPTASSTLYSSPVTVSTSETVNAIAIATGYINSAVAEAAYTINIPGGFGSLPVNIGSNTTATVTVTILSAATLGNISVLTQGASNLDFTNAGAGSCAVGTAYAAGAACTVRVTFAPKFAGTRVGAVVLTDSTGSQNVMATAYLQGLGQGPQIAFSPGATGFAAYECGTFTSGIAVDGSGNLFVLDDGSGTVWKLTPGNATGCYIQPTKIGIFQGAKDITIDGSGSLYIAGNTLYKESLLPDGSYQQTTVAGGFVNSWGVAVDASGNVYIAVDGASSNQAAVYKETLQANGSYVQSTIGSGWTQPSGLAVDGNGNVYIADFSTGVVVKETLANATYTQTTIDSELFHPAGVAVDGTGNVYISDDIDSPFEDGSPAIFKEIPQSGGGYDRVTIANYPTFSPESLAVDGGGNIYYADSYGNGAYELNFENPPSLGFASTTHGTISKDSPQTVTAYNFGNAALNFSAVSYPIDFPEGSPDTNDCKASISLAANQSCTLTVDFMPVTAIGSSSTSLSLSENVEVTTNSLNTTGALQAIAVAGTEVEPVTAAPIFSVPGGQYTSPQSVALTDSTPGSTIYYTTNGAQPTTASTQYAGPINVSTPEAIFAFAVAPGYSPSAVAQQDYFIDTLTPVFSVPAGTYASAQTVAITDSSAGAVIYYTTDGTTPIPSSTKYTGPIYVASTETIKAVAYAPGLDASAFASATYTIHLSTTGELQFVPITPCRIADTRNPAGAFGGPELAAGATRTFNLPQSACNIPSTATAYALNVTVVPDGDLGYLTVYPAGVAQPYVSTLNSDGRVKANATITAAGTNGGVNVYASNPTQVILDISGYFVPAGTSTAGIEFYPLAPCRVADTRNPAGAFGGPFLAANTSRDFPMLSSPCNIPATAKAYSLNITAVPHASLGYLTAWPAGQSKPPVSTLNAYTGAVTANAAIVSAGSSGEVSLYVSDDADVILDINGYFAPPASGGLSLYTVAPCRALDTRTGAGAFNGLLTVPIQTSPCAPPSAAQAYVLNATVVPAASLGYLTIEGSATSQPNVSTLNASDEAITSNMAIVPAVNGSINAYASNPTQLILDLSGYFAP